MDPASEQAIRERLDTDAHSLEASRSQLNGYVESLAGKLTREAGFRSRAIESRIKPAVSVLRKVEEQDGSADSVYGIVGDILGARLVAYNRSDIELFKDAILTDDSCPLEDVTSEDIAYASGYRAVHINGRLGTYGCEIQIRTVVQDAWAVVSRADMYRASDGDDLGSRLIAAQSSVLSGVDDVLQAVRDLSGGESPADVSGSADVVSERERDLIAERMSNATPPVSPPDESELLAALENLEPEERLILESAPSSSRVETLRAGVEVAMKDMPTRKLFGAVQTYERRFEYQPSMRFGVALNSFKGPFVEGSNWAEYRPSEMAIGFERYLLNQFTALLERRLDSSTEPLTTIDGIREFVRTASQEISDDGGTADIVVLRSDATTDVRLELWNLYDWQNTPLVRGVSIRETTWIQPATLEGLPILDYAEVDHIPALYVVDLSGYQLTQYNPAEESPDDIHVSLSPIDQEEAVRLLAAQPEWAEEMYKAGHNEAGAYSREEATIRLQLRVGLELLAAGEVREAYAPRLRSRRLGSASV